VPVTVLTLPGCAQCNQTKFLVREGIAFETGQFDEDPDLLAAFKEEGPMRAPWSGRRRELDRLPP
jgi:glutaredoxin